MQAIKMAAMLEMDSMRNMIRELEYKREQVLNDITIIHSEIGHAKIALENLEGDFKKLSQMDMPVSNSPNGCNLAAGNGINKACH